MSARRSLSSEDWYSNLDNLLKHCGDGRIVSVGNATANEIKQKVHQYIEQETKLSPEEREQFQRLNQYLAYFDEGASDDKNYKAAKSASKALLFFKGIIMTIPRMGEFLFLKHIFFY